MRGLEPVSFYPAQGVCFRSSSWTSLAAMTSRDEAHPGARASRPHNTGKASPNSSTRVDRQRRRGSASAGLMRFPPAGGRLPHRGETERHATVVHAGGTPALPGGRLFQSLLLLEGAHAGLPVRRPCRCGTAVPLRGPSRSFVSLRGSLFFRLFQTTSAALNEEFCKRL